MLQQMHELALAPDQIKVRNDRNERFSENFDCITEGVPLELEWQLG